MSIYKDLLKSSLEIIHSENSVVDKMQSVCDLLTSELDYYDWSGFYMSDVKKRVLYLGPYSGETTDHTIIPYGKGICGQAAETEKTFLIDDVMAEGNYISCNINVKSEIVVPILKNGIVVGQIDIDSNKASAFSTDDQYMLEKICTELALYIE